jgi:Uma2 family endonuclease
MATIREVEYPTSDGKPMAETELHGQDLMDVILTLKEHFAADPNVYAWGNMLMYYVEGDPTKHVAPDFFFVRGVPKLPPRLYYQVWKEGKAPDVIIEIASKTTRRVDEKKKPVIYRDVLKVREYFQFDPKEEYLKPSMQGHRLVRRQYVPIAPREGRLPSKLLGLHLERHGTELRFYDPATGRWLLTPRERAAEAEAALLREAEARQRAETENERLRRQLEALKRRLSEDV